MTGQKTEMMVMLISLCTLCLCGDTAFGASPNLGAILPRGAQRGTEIQVTLNGNNLADAQELIAYYPGITVAKFEPVNNTQAKATLKIAPDCRLGEHAFRVRTASGVSDLRTFWVGALPVVEEKEGNNSFETPQPIPLNVTVHGVVRAEQVDYYAVECKKGQRLSVEIEGMRLGHTFFDPFVAILDSKRFELVTGDDSPLTGQDGGCSVVIPADGKYLIQVRETAYQGNDACLYRLHVGNFPRPTGVVPAGGKPGEEVEFRFVGDPLGEIKQKVKLPAAGDPQFRIHCQTAEGIHPAGIKVRVEDLPGVVESGANNSPQTATTVPVPGAAHGIIAKDGEVDFFSFPAKKGQVFDVRVYARRLGSPIDPVVHVGVKGGAYIAGNDDAGGPDSALRFTAPDNKEIAVWIHDHLRKGGPDYFYRIEVTPVRPGTVTSIPKVDGNNQANQDRQVFSVPRGNRFATLVRATRQDWGGPAALGFDKLPGGVKVDAPPYEPGIDVVPVVFEAVADAPLAGVLTGLNVHPSEPKLVLPSTTSLDTTFSLGINNTQFHRLEARQTVIAATEAAPFLIDVVEPKVPVVQNGQYSLKVIAKRQPGFAGVITVYPLWTPIGMGIAGSAQIPANATETTLFVNAAPNAPVKVWKTAVIAVSDAGKGAVWVSSPLFKLEVAPPMVTFAQERAAVEQGQKTQVVAKINVASPFEGKAKVQLLGLPAKATAAPLEFSKDQKELAFDVTTDKTSPAGKHGVFCQVVIEKNGEPVIHNVGGGELRIDVPLPPKAAPTAPPAGAKPTAPAPPPEKRLSRLEQLRKEQEEKEKAAKKDEKKN
jgi:hypothetical protein